jgi:regulator of protease activity HflC (stomatin/prohibitin superfamily)
MKKQQVFLWVLFVITLSSCGNLKQDIIIESSEVGVVYHSLDEELKVLKPGVHSVPIKDYVYRYPTKRLTFIDNMQVGTEDGKAIIFRVETSYSLIKKREVIKEFHLKIGPDFEQRFIASAMRSSVRSVIGQMNSQEIQLDSIPSKVKAMLKTSDFSSYIEIHELSCKLRE